MPPGGTRSRVEGDKCTRSRRAASIRRRCFGRSDEWHLDFAKSFQHITFDLASRLCEAVVILGSAFGHSRLEAVGAIGDAVLGDCPQHLSIERLQVLDSTMCLLADHRLKCVQHLECRLETDRSRRDPRQSPRGVAMHRDTRTINVERAGVVPQRTVFGDRHCAGLGHRDDNPDQLVGVVVRHAEPPKRIAVFG
jgi:hypothetical protein